MAKVWWWRQWRWKRGKDYFRRRNWRLCIMPRPLSSWSIGPPQLHLTSVPPFIDEGTFMKDTRVLFLLLLLFDHVCLSMEIQAQDSFGHTWYLSFFLHNVIWGQEILHLKVYWFQLHDLSVLCQPLFFLNLLQQHISFEIFRHTGLVKNFWMQTYPPLFYLFRIIYQCDWTTCSPFLNYL